MQVRWRPFTALAGHPRLGSEDWRPDMNKVRERRRMHLCDWMMGWCVSGGECIHVTG